MIYLDQNPKLGVEFATSKLLTGGKNFMSQSEKFRTLGQQTAVLRYAKKGRIAKKIQQY